MDEVVITQGTLFGILTTLAVVLFAGVLVTEMFGKRKIALVLVVVAGAFGVFSTALLVSMPEDGDKGNVFMVVVGALYGFMAGSAVSNLGWLKMKPEERSLTKTSKPVVPKTTHAKGGSK
ncbi:hypothetical protein HY440_00185 [Candidatus Microgenomates bacterium]|nr:hypothetical protein [Candidatus Microgenomates bacterium]